MTFREIYPDNYEAHCRRPRPLDFMRTAIPWTAARLMVNAGLAEITKLFANNAAGGQLPTKFDYMAIGTGATAAAATDTALQTEITTNGGARVAGTTTLVTSAVTNDTMNFVASWTFTGTFGVRELGIFNGTSVTVGDPANASGSRMLLRQLFAANLNVISQDTLQLTVQVTSSDLSTSDSTTRLTNSGFVEGNKLIATDLTPANGAITHIAVGSGSTAPAASDTTLQTEISSNGLSRAAATVTVVTTTVTNDTVRASVTFSVTGTQAVREVGLFNASSAGVMWWHVVFTADLNLVNTDTLTIQMNMTQSG